ncbi:choice-of-anchor J domain-containing protein [Flavobacterium sp.]|uniref:T9SS type A sorting domain-containing protein n=1 Tax=Flavobacterium sp. TaxID=239 RepID=UPI0039190233
MKKLLLSFLLIGSLNLYSQSTIFAENWDGIGPGIDEWILYNLDNRTPVGPGGTEGEALSYLIQDAWTVLSLFEIQEANENFEYAYPAAATGMADNIIASNSWYTPVGVANDWLVSPLIEIPAGATGVTLKWAATSLGSSSFLEDYQVYISPTGGPAVANFTTLLLDVNNELNTGNYRTVALNGYAGTSIRIAFRNDGNDQYVMFLDNISIDGTLSSTEFTSSKFSTYPNPANNLVTISNNENILVSNVTITDINGRTIKNVSVNNLSTVQMNVSDLTSGVYFMNIDSDSGKAVKKFIKS